MGLDMYLRANFEVPKEKEIHVLEVMGISPNDFELNERFSQSELFVQIGYWRKANAIHNWFVKNVQKGKDDCNPYYVSKESLMALLDHCNQILANRSKAEKLLPVASGFFFGSSEYDDWYFENIESTIKIVRKAIELQNKHLVQIYYQSSW